jgi:hypothetical protein
MSIEACMLRYSLLLLYLTFAWAQSPVDRWLNISQQNSLPEIERLLLQPNAPAWPELATVPSPLASQIHQRIIELEGQGVPEIAAIPARVQMYAALAQRFRAAHGYANYVLTDSLQALSILQLARLVVADRSRAAESSALLRSLDLPLLTPRVFEEIYQAKLGPQFHFDGSTPEAMLAAMEKLGDATDGFPRYTSDTVLNFKAGGMLARLNPAGLLIHLSDTDVRGRGALAQLIEFVEKGGRLEDLNTADVRKYEKLIPLDTPRLWGILRTSAGILAVQDLIEAAGDPEAAPLLWALDGPRRAARSRFQVKETPLGHVEEFQSAFQMGISPDNRRFNYIVKRDGKETFVNAQGESRAYDRIGQVLYNPQSTRVAFIAAEGKQERVVLDGLEGQLYDRIDGRDLHFSPDGRHFAFAAARGSQQFISLDGHEIGPFEDVLGLAFSPDQQLIYAHMFRRNGRWTIVCGDHQSGPYERVSGARGVTFSPDGKTWTYQATLNGQFFNFVEGAQTIAYPGNGNELREKPVFSTDGRRIMFPNGTRDGSGAIEAQFVNVGAPGITNTIQADKVYFSPDLRRLAAVKRTAAGLYSVAVDNREWQVSSINPPVIQFNASGDHFAIQWHDPGTGKNTSNLIIDGNSAPDGPSVAEFVFNSDGNHWAYAANTGSVQIRNIIVRDGKEIHSLSWLGNQTRLVFSPDSRHLAYSVAHGPGTSALAIDGEEVPANYDFFPYYSRIVFDSSNQLYTIAVRNNEVLLVELSWSN